MPADEITKTRQPAKLSDLTDEDKYYTLWPSGRTLIWTATKPVLVQRVDVMPGGLGNTNQLFICILMTRTNRDGTTTDEKDIVPAANLGLDPNVETDIRTYELLAV